MNCRVKTNNFKIGTTSPPGKSPSPTPVIHYVPLGFSHLAHFQKKIVQQQCRHQSVAQTDAYLRDLGLHSNYDVLKGWIGAA
jgi:hypothetical protein